MKIVAINGKGGTGKDEFVAACMEKDDNIKNISMVDYVKEVAERIGWDGKKDAAGRRFLSDIKDALDEYNDMPYQYCIDVIQFILDKYEREKKPTNDLVIFVHCREMKDIERWADDFNAFALLIRRPSVDVFDYGNHADDNVFKGIYDYTYMNTGNLNDLKADAQNFIEWLRLQNWNSYSSELHIWDDPRCAKEA